MKIDEIRKFYEDQDWSDFKKHIALVSARYGVMATAFHIVEIFKSFEEPFALGLALSEQNKSVKNA